MSPNENRTSLKASPALVEVFDFDLGEWREVVWDLQAGGYVWRDHDPFYDRSGGPSCSFADSL